jgi:hypothetical protein
MTQGDILDNRLGPFQRVFSLFIDIRSANEIPLFLHHQVLPSLK